MRARISFCFPPISFHTFSTTLPHLNRAFPIQPYQLWRATSFWACSSVYITIQPFHVSCVPIFVSSGDIPTSALKEPRRPFFFCLLLLFFSSRSYTISSVYMLAVGNTPYGKRHTSRTMSVTPLQSILEESFHSRQSFWHYRQINSTLSSTPKTPQRRTPQIALRQHEKRTSSRATDVV